MQWRAIARRCPTKSFTLAGDEAQAVRAGGFDESVPRSSIGGIRQEEQRKAAAALGVTDVDFLGYPDGRLTVTHELRRDITRAIRRVRPDRLVIQSPVRDIRSMYGSHPDHQGIGHLPRPRA